MKQKLTKKEIPDGIKVISVLYFIGSVLGIIFGLLFLLGAGMMASIMTDQIPWFGMAGASFFLLSGLIMLGWSCLQIFVGIGLWKGKQWARTVAIVFSIFGLLTSLIFFNFMSFFGVIVNITIGIYLLFNKNVKNAFA